MFDVLVSRKKGIFLLLGGGIAIDSAVYVVILSISRSAGIVSRGIGRRILTMCIQSYKKSKT
jgi:hypothetical protein